MNNMTPTKRYALMVLMFLSAWGLCFSLTAETLNMIPDNAFPRHRQPPVAFDHDAHNAKAGLDTCTTCHHVYENGVLSEESSEGTPCADCHQPYRHPEAMNLSRAYHKQCKGCHLSQGQGPIFCGECHKKP